MASYPQFTTCAAPGDARPFGDSWLGMSILSLVLGGLAGGIWWLIATILGAVTPLGCTIGVGALGFLLTALHAFKHWYYNSRLMCIQEDRCVIGTLTGEPSVASDGDQKYDLLVAPFTPEEAQGYFAEVILDNPAQFGTGPTNPSDAIALQNYVEALGEETRKRLYMRVAHEKMFTQSGHDFFKHFLIRDESVMGSNAFNHSDDDTFATSDPNPMFRMSPQDSLAPYMHCEIEGNRLERWLTNLLIAFWTLFVSFTALCAICVYFTGQDWACSWIASAAAALLAFLVWLISHFVNDPDEGEADQTDVDFSDPAYEGDTGTILQGDTLVVFGDWIMDTEHGQYFELHPIKAIYMLCSQRGASDEWEFVNDLTAYPRNDRCPYDVTLLTPDDAAEICEMVEDAETVGFVESRTWPLNVGLSHAAGLI